MRDCACVSIPSVILFLLAFAICCVHYGSRLFNSLLAFYLHFMHLFLLLAFCDEFVIIVTYFSDSFSDNYADLEVPVIVLTPTPLWPPLA